MRFIVDAHLPKQIAIIFSDLGHEVVHTSQLPKRNETSDEDILEVYPEDGIVVSKDEDFYLTFLLYRKPVQLILVKVGNLKLRAVTDLFSEIAPKLIDLLGQHDLLEIHRDKIIVIA